MARILIAGLAAFLLLPCAAAAHDIPNDVTVQAFVKPHGQHLYLLVRVPLRAMRDFQFPERGLGYLDIRNASALLPEAATQWLSNFVELYEGGTPLPKPQILAARLALMSDGSFYSYETALAHVTGPGLSDNTNVAWDQTLPFYSNIQFNRISPRFPSTPG